MSIFSSAIMNHVLTAAFAEITALYIRFDLKSLIPFHTKRHCNNNNNNNNDTQADKPTHHGPGLCGANCCPCFHNIHPSVPPSPRLLRSLPRHPFCRPQRLPRDHTQLQQAKTASAQCRPRQSRRRHYPSSTQRH